MGAASAALALPGCGDKETVGGTETGEASGFCYSMADADTTLVEEGGGSGASGLLDGRLITDESDDFRDPALVVNVDYTIQNLDVGGSPLLGKTDSQGSFVESLGDGTWLLRLSDSKGGYTCRNEIEFAIEAGNTTRMCLDVACE
jgi:hypothetical protein